MQDDEIITFLKSLPVESKHPRDKEAAKRWKFAFELMAAFGDGLMVIRKLFGSAFAGEALTAKAISADATRSSTEVHEYIQGGVDNLMLDVDGDGKVTAFGDGLMVIRKLFGTAFSGDALTDKAISADATRDTDEIHEYITAMTTVDPIG